MSSIKNFIIKHLNGAESVNTTFTFWSPYAKRSIVIDVLKNSHFCQCLMDGNYSKALDVIRQHYSIYDWWSAGHVEIFDVVGNQIVFKQKGIDPGYDIREFNLMYLTAISTIFWSYLKNDPDYRQELELEENSSLPLMKRFFEAIKPEIPEYNIAPEGSYDWCIAA